MNEEIKQYGVLSKHNIEGAKFKIGDYVTSKTPSSSSFTNGVYMVESVIEADIGIFGYGLKGLPSWCFESKLKKAKPVHHLQVGMVYVYKGKPVYITDGNSIRNFWHWQSILKNGKLGKKDCGYNEGKFFDYPNDWEVRIYLKE